MTISASTTNIYKTNYSANQVAQQPTTKENEDVKPEGKQPPPPPPPEGKGGKNGPSTMSEQELNNAQGMLTSKSSVNLQSLTSETSTVEELTSEVEEDNETSELEMLQSMVENTEETKEETTISNAVNQYVKTNATSSYSFNVIQ
ncbi:hypothetical protein AN640_02370 [Candidatus Epulonipiscium fishelsonii]|uniref:Uncharacterized protein n=1 Tax=Candidatus Epulonipiscium fishelsonii TaxID=77094 RepID=A0ACC8X9F2_9FIRM|nr:hypothetical protein AN640_02370 [Epulopiscium sp. SCG-D08WGA-EpuloA1]